MKILLSVALALFLAGCGSDTKEEAKAIKQESEVKKQESVAKSQTDSVSDSAKVEPIKDEAVAAAEAVKEEAVAKAEEVKAEVAVVAESAKTEVAAKVEEVKATASASSAATLFQVCAGCHGADASKAALGKSQIIKGWDAKKIADALHGYKAGTYGGAMKSLMVTQVSKLSDDDIKALSEHISKL